MQVERFFSASLSLSKEIQDVDTVLRLRQLSADVKGLMPNQTVAEDLPKEATGYREQWMSLRSDLELCPSNFAGTARRVILKEIGATKLTGIGLVEAVENIFRESNVRPTDTAKKLEKLSVEVENLRERVERLTKDLKDLGIEPERLEAGQCQIEIHIPKNDEPVSMEELAKIVKVFDQHLRPLAQLGKQVDYKGVTLCALTPLGWEMFLNVELRPAVILSVLMRGLSNIQVKHERRKKIRETTEALYPPYVLEEMDRADSEWLGAEYRKLAQQLVEGSQVSHGESMGKSEELVRQSIEFIAERMAENVLFDLRAEPEMAMSPKEAQAQPEAAERKRKAIEEARQINFLNGALLALREGRAIPHVVARALSNHTATEDKVATAAANG